MEPLITLDSEGAHISSEKVSKAFEKKDISATMITGLEGCHARWLMDTFVAREIIHEEPDNPARRGKVFHTVMEHFFAHDANERTPGLMKKTVKETLESPDYIDLKDNRDVREWLRDAVNGYYKIGAKPQNITVAKIKDRNGNEKPALEQFVKNRVTDSRRKTLGFIDRVIEDPREGHEDQVIVEDWKTGAKAKKWNGESDEGFPEQRQQTLYSMMLENEGVDVSRARLIYPVAQEIVKVDPNDEKLRERVKDDVHKTDNALDHLSETNTFEYTPSFLCHFCPLVKYCPEAQVRKVGKLKTAYESQPGLDILSKGIEFK